MHSFSTEELQAAIVQLDQALYNHDHWYKNLLRTLILRLPADEADLQEDAHCRCRFGQWYNGLSEESMRAHPGYLALGPIHKKVHDCARTILQRVARGEDIAEEEFDQFNGGLDNLRLEFQALRNDITEIAQNRDPLTGARNRNTLLTALREQQALAGRGVQTCSLIMLDIDHFKRVNDDYGHAAGDSILVATVRCLQEMVRPYDRIYRYGGEEFLLCAPGMTLEQAYGAADRMREAIAEQALRLEEFDKELHVTVSLGVATLSPYRTVEESIDCADKAMYAAKRAGRNCVRSEADS